MDSSQLRSPVAPIAEMLDPQAHSCGLSQPRIVTTSKLPHFRKRQGQLLKRKGKEKETMRKEERRKKLQ